MKTHEQMFDEWFAEMQSKADASGLTNDDIKAGVIRFARRVAEEQRERDARIAEEAAPQNERSDWTKYAEDIDRCSRGIAELEGIISQHNLCHDLHGKVGVHEFAEGCKREITKIYGSCPWDDELTRLRAVIKEIWQESKEYVHGQSISLIQTSADEPPTNIAAAISAAFWNLTNRS